MSKEMKGLLLETDVIVLESKTPLCWLFYSQNRKGRKLSHKLNGVLEYYRSQIINSEFFSIVFRG